MRTYKATCDRCHISIDETAQDWYDGWTHINYYESHPRHKDTKDLCPECGKKLYDFFLNRQIDPEHVKSEIPH